MTWMKIFSGQFVFTVVTAWAFAYAVVAKILTAEQIYLVITLVVTFYFNKPKNGGSNEQVDSSSGASASSSVVSKG